MNRMNFGTSRIVFAVLLSLLLSSLSYGQLGKGVVTGAVTDPTGAVVPGAQVTLLNPATGVQRTHQTNASGIYRFDFTDVGTYVLKVEARGFSNLELTGVVVTVGQIVSNDLKLELAKGAVQTITVEAQGVQMVNTSSAEISQLINRNTIQNLPLEVRDTTVFVNLVPGSVPNEFNDSTRGAAVNGMRGGTGNWMIDGMDNNDYGQGGRGKNTLGSLPGGLVSISPEAVQEFRVVTDNFSAEYGRQAGFVTDLALKSGTNKVHGSVFEYNRNTETTGNDFFSSANGLHDNLIRNQFGGSLGGPIKKDKMFIFGAIELQRIRQSLPITTTALTQEFINYVNEGGLADYYGIDCAATGNLGCTTGDLFNELQSKYPMPLATKDLTNVSSSPWVGGYEYPVNMYGQATYSSATIFNENRIDLRYDYQISSKDTLSGHYLFDDFDTSYTGQGGDFFNPSFPYSAPGRAENAGLSWTHTISPTVVNDLKISYLRNSSDFPYYFEDIPSIGTADALTTGFGSSSNVPQKWAENTFQYQDTVSISRGKHTFKIGGEFRRTRNGSAFEADKNGLFYHWDMEDLLTDGAFGDILGFWGGGFFLAEASINPSSLTPARPEYYRGYRANELAWFAQDQYKVSDRVTINLGVRYDYFGVPHNFRGGIDSNLFFGSPAYNQCTVASSTGETVCYPAYTSTTSPLISDNPNYPISPYTASVFSGAFRQTDHGIWNKDTNNFAPRFGIAWDVFGNQKTILRTGGGIFYDRMYNNIFENMRFNAPFFTFADLGYYGGTTVGPISTPGLYAAPINVSYWSSVNATGSARQIDQNLVTAYAEQVNFDIQHQFSADWMVDMAYVGTFGHKLMGLNDINTFPGRYVYDEAGDPLYGTSRVNPNVTGDNMRGNWWKSNYHSLQTKVSKRFSRGFQFETSYTYSHALDYVSDAFNNRFAAGLSNQGFPEDTYRRYLDYGSADFDLRHRWIAYGMWDLPVFKNHKYLGGWSLDATFALQSGSPFSIYDTSSDTNGDGYYGDRATYTGSGSPMSTVTHSVRPADGYIRDTSTFITTPISATTGWSDGMLGRNVMTGPKYTNTDFSFSKKFQFNERLGLKIIVSAFNVLNHPNFKLPVSDLSNTSTFGKSIATMDVNNSGTGARVVQFGGRLEF